jgi:hypothetical protein
MTISAPAAPPRITEMLGIARNFSARERLILAKLLLDSIVSDEVEDDLDWQDLSLSAFERDWDNPEDAVYDHWREIYGVPAR